MNALQIAFLKTKVGLLAAFTQSQLEELARGSSVAVLESGEVVVHAGDELHFLGVEANAANLRNGARGFVVGIQHED